MGRGEQAAAAARDRIDMLTRHASCHARPPCLPFAHVHMHAHSALAQRFIYRHQNPADCRSAKFLVAEFDAEGACPSRVGALPVSPCSAPACPHALVTISCALPPM